MAGHKREDPIVPNETQPKRSAHLASLDSVHEESAPVPSQAEPPKNAEEPASPLKKESLRNALLRPAKTFRDAVHQDIMLTHLEVALVDTDDFQRLRGIKQLGTTFEVFPSAVHTRFEHSLGTLHCAQKIIDAINGNPFPGTASDGTELRVNVQDTFMIRLCALLHDLSHIPFGHTLEDEARLFYSQWNDEERLNRYLGGDSQIASVLRADRELNSLAERNPEDFDESFDPANLRPDRLLASVRKTLQAIEAQTVYELDKPYIADIVGNTLCADLLDYIKRDMYFLGLQETFDERFVTYVYLAEFEGTRRTVLRLIKPTKTVGLRRDVLSEFIQLLRLRYSLAEKALYHHTKVSTSAMVMSAVGSEFAQRAPGEQRELGRRIYGLDDSALLAFLREFGTGVSKRLSASLSRRCLVKPAYRFSRSEPSGELFEKKDAAVQRFIGASLRPPPREPRQKGRVVSPDLMAARKRFDFERGLERLSGLSPGDVVLYCPIPNLGVKLIKTLVQVGKNTVGPAEEVLPSDIMNEFRYSVSDKHRDLWSFQILLNSEAVSKLDPGLSWEQISCNVAGDAQSKLLVPNEIHHGLTYQPWAQRYEDNYSARAGVPRLPAARVEELVSAGTRGGEVEWLPFDAPGDEFSYSQKRRQFVS